MREPLVSVIIPIYKTQSYLRRCVDSVLTQTHKNLEIILVDDGSPDRCAEICDEYAKKDGRIRVIHKENEGVSRARNRGIETASGEYLTFVDSDDYVSEKYVEYLLSLFGEAENCAITACNHFILGRNRLQKASNGKNEKICFTRRDAFESLLYHEEIDVSPWAKMYRRSVFGTVRFPEGVRYEDTGVFGEILEQTRCLVFGSEAAYYYVQHRGSFVNSGFSAERLDYIRAVEQLTKHAIQCDPCLEAACERRMVHAKCSTLRYMKNCPPGFEKIRDQLREEILAQGSRILKDARAPKRDKIAVILLKLGYAPFFRSWELYNLIR